MAETPLKPGVRPRPLSPHLTIYRWPVTMLTSIVHRITGVGLVLGTALLCWWLVALSSGLEAYGRFAAASESIIGQVILFGFVWSLAFHLLNGVRHLAWDTGYGFKVKTANRSGVLVLAGSLVITLAAFALAWSGQGGYLS